MKKTQFRLETGNGIFKVYTLSPDD